MMTRSVRLFTQPDTTILRTFPVLGGRFQTAGEQAIYGLDVQLSITTFGDSSPRSAHSSKFIPSVVLNVFVQVLQYKTKKHRFSPVIASQQQFISSLDSAMNKWVENDIPSHCRCSFRMFVRSITFPSVVLHPSNNNVYDPLFRQQTAYLYVSYYALQLYIHKVRCTRHSMCCR